jgi:hypothetical protein
MADQNLAEWGILKFIKERKNCSARIIEQDVYPFLLQTFNDDLRTSFFHTNPKSPQRK